jgi:triacylglycerol lipase
MALALLVAACSSTDAARSNRCAKVNAQVSSCLGKGAPLFDCSTVSDADLSAAETLTSGPACQLVGEAPIDGDSASASCHLYGIDCVRSIQKPPVHAPTRYPVVLVNGIDTSPLFRYSSRIQDTLRAQGNHVYLATLTPYQAPQKRAPLLAARIEQVLKETGATKVNLVCHSLGGLDCRYVTSPGGLAADLGQDAAAISSKVASVTTIGTAHRGTRVADVALGLVPGGDAELAVTTLTSVLGDWFSSDHLVTDTDVRAAMQSLTTSAMKAFNADVPDAKGVYYQSFAGFSRKDGASTPAHDDKIRAGCTPSDPGKDGDGLTLFRAHDRLALPLVPLYAIAGSGETDLDLAAPNDGLVTLDSAAWGAFRGCIPADHMEQLGQYNLPSVNVRTGVDIAWFYASITADLAARGL